MAYTPFVSVILFILIGEIFNAYAYSWLIFLLIPIMGVLVVNYIIDTGLTLVNVRYKNKHAH